MTYPFFSALLAQTARIYNFEIAANMAGNAFASDETLNHISDAHPMRPDEEKKVQELRLNNVRVLDHLANNINK